LYSDTLLLNPVLSLFSVLHKASRMGIDSYILQTFNQVNKRQILSNVV